MGKIAMAIIANLDIICFTIINIYSHNNNGGIKTVERHEKPRRQERHKRLENAPQVGNKFKKKCQDSAG